MSLPLLVAIAIGLWYVMRKRKRVPSLSVVEARRVLELPALAGREEILDAHRRLIRRVHPDAGGSSDLAHRVNAARDILLSELNRAETKSL